MKTIKGYFYVYYVADDKKVHYIVVQTVNELRFLMERFDCVKYDFVSHV